MASKGDLGAVDKEPSGPDETYQARSASLAHLWTKLSESIVSSPLESHMRCEILVAGDKWAPCTVIFDGDTVRLSFDAYQGTKEFITISGAHVVGHIVHPFVQILSGPQLVVFHAPESFVPLVAALLAGSKARPKGLLAKKWTPPPPSLTEPHRDLLVCALDAHFTSFSSHSKVWQRVLGKLKRSGRLELWLGTECLFVLDMTRVEESYVRHVDPSLVQASQWVLFVNPDLGGPESVYMRFNNDNDFEDWMMTVKFFSRPTVYTDTRHLSRHSLRICRQLRIHISSYRSNGAAKTDLSNVYVDIQFNRWSWARTVLNSEPDEAAWGQEFVFQGLSNFSEPLELVLQRTDDSRRPSTHDEELGRVEISNYSSTETWFPLINEDGTETGASLFVSLTKKDFEVIDASWYRPLQRYLRNLDRNVASDLVEASHRHLSSLCALFTDVYRGEGKHIRWIKHLISVEVTRLASVDSEHSRSTLFRGNTLPSRALERFLQLYGIEMLQNTVGRFVRMLIQNGADEGLELDPSRLPAGPETDDAISRNGEVMKSYLDYLWMLILTEEIPPAFNCVFSHFSEELKTKLNATSAEVHSSLATFIFLRFFCPALLSPQLFNLTDAGMSPGGRRTLTLLAKLLQRFAGKLRFKSKEPWLLPFNSFFDEHGTQLDQWYEQLIVHNKSDELPLRQRKALPQHRFMNSELTNPYLIDVPAAYASLAYFVAELDLPSNDFVQECRKIVATTAEIHASLEEPDLPQPVSSDELAYNLDLLLFSQNKALLHSTPQGDTAADDGGANLHTAAMFDAQGEYLTGTNNEAWNTSRHRNDRNARTGWRRLFRGMKGPF